MSILLIDDLRDFREEYKPDNYDIARTSEEAIQLLSENEYDTVYWDHDLGGDDTTMEVVSWLLRRSIEGDRKNIGTCYVHTSNPVGAVNLKNAFESRYLLYKVIRIDASQLFIVE